MNSSRELALAIYDELNPEATLKDIETRVWMLKSRNIPNSEVLNIIKTEYASTPTQPHPSISVNHLPDDYNREDWS